MAEIHSSIPELIRESLGPSAKKALEELKKHSIYKNLLPLASYHCKYTLTQLEDVQRMIDGQSDLSNEVKETFKDLAKAWYCMHSGRVPEEYTLEIAQKTSDCIDSLGRRRDYDKKSDRLSLLTKTSTGIMKCTSSEELEQWIVVLKRLHQEFPQESIASINVLEEKVATSMWRHHFTMDMSALPQKMQLILRARRQIRQQFGLPMPAQTNEDMIISQLGEALRHQQQIDQLRRQVPEMLADDTTIDTYAEASITSSIYPESEGDSVIFNITPDYSEASMRLYNQVVLRNMGNVSNWAQLKKLKENPDYLIARQEVEVAVWKAQLINTGEVVAVKVYRTQDQRHLNIYQREVEYLDSLSKARQPVFLKFYGSFLDEIREDQRLFYRLSIVMEYCPKTLKALSNQTLPSAQLHKLVKDTIDGFAYLEYHKIYHQDVKPENIFMTEENQFKIGDFNVSKSADSRTLTMHTGMHNIQGTEAYFSPELRKAWAEHMQGGPKQISYSPIKSDVFSLGLTLLQAATGKITANLNKEGDESRVQNLINASAASSEIKDLLRDMLRFPPNQRPTFSALSVRIN